MLIIARIVTLLAAFALAVPASSAREIGEEVWELVSLPPAALSKAMVDKHPGVQLVFAQELFKLGRKDEAVFWFYVGQLRFRSFLASKPGQDPSGAPAAFSALFQTIGPPINQYAFGDIPALAATIERVLAWDSEHADPLTPKGPERDQVRAGLQRMKADMLARQDEIRAQRKERGLENRTK